MGLAWASCIRTTGMWSFLFCFGVAMLDSVMASSSSSMRGRNSVPLRVVCDPKLLSSDKPRVLWLKELCLSFSKSDQKNSHHKPLMEAVVISNTERAPLIQLLHLGWDTISSTSSGLFCKMAAASLNVTPSKLVLFREMRRPPAKINRKMSPQNPWLL